MITGIQFLRLSKRELLSLDPSDLKRGLSKDELEKIFQACDAFWIHPGQKNPKAPHVELTSGKHSSGYINCPQVLSRSNLCQIMAYQMGSLLRRSYDGPIDWVVGSDSSALGLSKDVANFFNARWHPMQKGPDKSQVWEKMTIALSEKVLHIEELVTTSLTTKAVRKGVRAGNAHEIDFIPFVPVLVYRPDQKTLGVVDGSRFIPLLSYDIYTVDLGEEECELCRGGSEALSAKEHWDELIVTM